MAPRSELVLRVTRGASVVLLFVVGALGAAGCDPASTADGGADARDAAGGDDAGVCDDPGVCLGGVVDGAPIQYRAGWWAPFRDGARWSITGGFTAADIDVCDYLTRREPVPTPRGFGFFLYTNEGDVDGNTLPDPGSYPVVRGWEGAHADARGVEVLAGGGGLEATGEGGSFDVEALDETSLTMRLDARLSIEGDFVHGAVVSLRRCDWFL